MISKLNSITNFEGNTMHNAYLYNFKFHVENGKKEIISIARVKINHSDNQPRRVTYTDLDGSHVTESVILSLEDGIKLNDNLEAMSNILTNEIKAFSR